MVVDTCVSFQGNPLKCPGLTLPAQTSGNCSSYCPKLCPGHHQVPLQLSTIFLLILVPVILLLLVYLHYKGYVLGCPSLLDGHCPDKRISGQRCKTTQNCTNSKPCCCFKAVNGATPCCCNPQSWASGRFLWGLALAHF